MAWERERINLYTTPEIKEYFSEKALEYGVSLTAIINTILKDFMIEDMKKG